MIRPTIRLCQHPRGSISIACFIVILTDLEPGSPWTCYRITWRGESIGAQISIPNLSDCAQAAASARDDGLLTRIEYRALRDDLASAGVAKPNIAPLLLNYLPRPSISRRIIAEPPKHCAWCGKLKKARLFYSTGRGTERDIYCKACRDAGYGYNRGLDAAHA